MNATESRKSAASAQNITHAAMAIITRLQRETYAAV
jgi:hypothetical protein